MISKSSSIHRQQLDLRALNDSSIGLRSGEYGGRNSKIHPMNNEGYITQDGGPGTYQLAAGLLQGPHFGGYGSC